MSKKKRKVEHVIDVLSHSLVPEMKVLGNEEKNRVLKKYGIDNSQLPKMLESDPAAVALKAVVGDIISIERNEPTGKYTAYRVVISD